MANYSFDDILEAIRQQESNGNTNAVGTYTPGQGQAQGSMQVMPETQRRFGGTPDQAGVAYLRYLADKTNNDPRLMAAGYFGGEGNIDSKNWHKKDVNGKSISQYTTDVMARLDKKKENSDNIDSLFADVPDKPVDSLFNDIPDKPSTILGYTGKEIYDSSKLATEVAGGLGGASLGGLLSAPTGPGAIAGAVAGASMGTVTANQLRKSLGTALGYESPQTPLDIAKAVGESALTGAAGEIGGQVISKSINQLAGDYLAQGVRDVLGGRATQPAINDTASTGIGLTAAEQSGSTRGIGIQHTLSSIPGARGVFAAKYDQQLEQATNALDDVVTNFAGTPGVTRDIAGTKIRTAFNNIVNTAFESRATQGRTDFALTDTMMKNNPYISVQTFSRTLRDEIAKLKAAGTPASTAKARQLTNTLMKVRRTDSMDTGFGINAKLSEYGRAAFDGSLFEGLSKDASDRAIAARLSNALDTDLTLASTPGQGQPFRSMIADSLRTARDNWRINSKVIKDLQDTTLGKMLGTDSPIQPHMVYDKVSKLQGPELANTTRMLDNYDPSIMADVRTRYLSGMIEKSSSNSMVTPAGDIVNTLGPSKFLKEVNKDTERLDVLFPNGDSNQIRAISRQLTRINQVGRPSRWLSHVASGSAGTLALYPALHGDLVGTATAASFASGVFLTSRQLARVLANPQGRSALSTVMNNSSSPSMVTRAFTYLAAQATMNGDE